VINSAAPIRICDIGDDDTWFSGYGRVFNIGVYPYVEVQSKYSLLNQKRQDSSFCRDYGENMRKKEISGMGHHPLLRQLSAICVSRRYSAANIHIFEPRAGCSTGTSAAVNVPL